MAALVRPPKYWGPRTTPKNIIKWITADTTHAPTYGDFQRAWCILGWKQSAKPLQPAFELRIINLWAWLRSFKSIKAVRAKTLILDALKTMGYYSPTWSVNSHALSGIGNPMAGYFSLQMPAGTPGVVGIPVWVNIPAPIGTAGPLRTYMRRNNNAVVQAACLAPTLPPRVPTMQESGGMPTLWDRQWRKYHRYMGFRASHVPMFGPPGVMARFFEAIHVPEGPNSLWHAISYHTAPQRAPGPGAAAALLPPEGNIWEHTRIKAEIYSYFRQVIDIANQAHVRHKDYCRLQDESKRVHPDWGELSILRSLACNNPDPANKPGYSCIDFQEPIGGSAAAALASVAPRVPIESTVYPWILWVIADYFGLEVIVFYLSELAPALGVPPLTRLTGQAAPAAIYSSRSFGFHPGAAGPAAPPPPGLPGGPGAGSPQILLVTDDWQNFEPVKWNGPLNVLAPGAPLPMFNTGSPMAGTRVPVRPWWGAVGLPMPVPPGILPPPVFGAPVFVGPPLPYLNPAYQDPGVGAPPPAAPAPSHADFEACRTGHDTDDNMPFQLPSAIQAAWVGIVTPGGVPAPMAGPGYKTRQGRRPAVGRNDHELNTNIFLPTGAR